MRVIARQLRDKIKCPGAIFAPGHPDVSQGPLGTSLDGRHSRKLILEGKELGP